MSKTLTCIGCGKVGRAMARLLSSRMSIAQVLTRSMESAAAAVVQIGAGKVANSYSELSIADYFFLAVPDSALVQVAQDILAAGVLSEQTTVVTASGLLPATALGLPSNIPVVCAHPIRSFADYQQLIESFAGTFFGVEGTADAVDRWSVELEALGAVPFRITAEKKLLYHAAAVVSSNYLYALFDAALRLYQQSGIETELGSQILSSIMQHSIASARLLGPATALTGPIVRGETALVIEQAKSIPDRDIQALYVALASYTCGLAKRASSGSPAIERPIASIAEIEQQLRTLLRE